MSCQVKDFTLISMRMYFEYLQNIWKIAQVMSNGAFKQKTAAKNVKLVCKAELLQAVGSGR